MYIDIDFENYGEFDITFFSTYDSTVTFSHRNGLKDCISFIEYHMTHDERLARSCITDSNTGEVVATISRKEK